MNTGLFVPPTDTAIPTDDLPPQPSDCDISMETADYEKAVVAKARATQFADWCVLNPGDKMSGMCGE